MGCNGTLFFVCEQHKEKALEAIDASVYACALANDPLPPELMLDIDFGQSVNSDMWRQLSGEIAVKALDQVELFKVVERSIFAIIGLLQRTIIKIFTAGRL